MSMLTKFKRYTEGTGRYLKDLGKQADLILELADKYHRLSDIDLRGHTQQYRDALANGYKLDQLQTKAFATAVEASSRITGLRPYKEQIMGGLILANGDLAEMKTGEGKSLTATLPAYYRALAGKGVHVITVNEYLSGRDAKGFEELYNYLGMSVGFNQSKLNQLEKREVYDRDITYTTNSELGFDYLRDNLVYKAQDLVMQRPLYYALVDEVDSVLIDDAKTPLIIASGGKATIKHYLLADNFAKRLDAQDYTVDLEHKRCMLTDRGRKKAEMYYKTDNLYSVDNGHLVHYLSQALQANYTQERDVDYIVTKKGSVELIDKFTGRVMDGRRYSDGLHQALEAKEGVKINPETSTGASITYQKYFRLYEYLSGMTGTAMTEENEFREVYHMRVVAVPTHRPIKRIDYPDVVYPTLKSKFDAVVEDVAKRHAKGQPVLVGTVAVENSERLSNLLDQAGIPHHTLNATHVADEAKIIINAGQRGAVTIATNMAGRGTDIKLGEGVKELGGLAVIGTERHESRRIDNQLRGRAGRQGDVGCSIFYLSLEDDLMKRFGGEKIKDFLQKMQLTRSDHPEPITSKMLTKRIESAQKRVEGNSYDERKNTLKYDNLLDEQRKVIYAQRREVLLTNTTLYSAVEYMEDCVLRRWIGECSDSHGDIKARKLVDLYNKALCGNRDEKLDRIPNKYLLSPNKCLVYLKHILAGRYVDLSEHYDLLSFTKYVILTTVDEAWQSQLQLLADLKEGIQLRSYAQLNPLVEYQRESFELYNDMLYDIQVAVLHRLYTGQLD